jgi:HlyD family secretion protein
MKRRIRLLIIAAIVVFNAGVYVKYAHRVEPPRVFQVKIDRGDVIDVASATGMLQATRTVEIGSQVTGVVRKLHADFNSIVHKGDVLAEIDPSLSEADLESARAAEQRAEVDLEQDQAVLENDRTNLGRAEELFKHDLSSEADKETAEVQTATDQLKVQQDSASVTIAQASVHQAQLNVDHCTITSPIDGIVISREVDEGQTVTSSMTAPTLYVLATDLTHLQLMGEIDESVIGKIHTGQDVAFTVDAYPGAVFHGQVDVMRLTSNTVNNVVTYDTVVSAQNPDLRLRPGMTASLRIEAARTTGVLRVPNLALRFKPTDRMFAGFHQSPDAGQPGKQVWKVQDGQLQSIPLQLGLTDGNVTEVRNSDLHAGDSVVVGIFVPPGTAR